MAKTLSTWLQQLSQSGGAIYHHRDKLFEQCQQVAKRLNINAFTSPVIAIVGTNGKGSCAALLAAIYTAAGCSVGMTTSPHLIKFNERININGHMADDQMICDAFVAIDQVLDGNRLGYFHMATLAALWIFKQHKVDVIILEAGCGGRFDAANVVDNDIAIITTIALDHWQWLGDSREKIAYEKAGIIRAHKPVVCGDRFAPAVIKMQAREQHCDYYQLGVDFDFIKDNGSWHWQPGGYYGDRLLKPKILLSNAATVLMATKLLEQQLPLTTEVVNRGLRNIRLHGRGDIIRYKPMVIVDVAHNAAAVEVLRQNIVNIKCQGCKRGVFGVMADKAIIDMITLMAGVIDYWYITKVASPRSAMPQDIAAVIAPVKAQCFDKAVSAYQTALNDSSEHDIIVVFGSFYVVAAILIENGIL